MTGNSKHRACCDCGEPTRRHLSTPRCYPCSHQRIKQAAETASARRMRSAHAAVGRAVRAGKLDSPKLLACCDCGGQAANYDHRWYSRPLDVEPVCARHNKMRGPAHDRLHSGPSLTEAA